MPEELRHRCDDCGTAMHRHQCGHDLCDWQICPVCAGIWSASRGFRRVKPTKETSGR
jgi:hypothetical protein